VFIIRTILQSLGFHHEGIDGGSMDLSHTDAIGTAEANRVKEIRAAENTAEAEKGKRKAEADRRVFIQGQETQVVIGENQSKAQIANAEAELAIKQADAVTEAAESVTRESELNV